MAYPDYAIDPRNMTPPPLHLTVRGKICFWISSLDSLYTSTHPSKSNILNVLSSTNIAYFEKSSIFYFIDFVRKLKSKFLILFTQRNFLFFTTYVWCPLNQITLLTVSGLTDVSYNSYTSEDSLGALRCSFFNVS